MTVIDVHAHYVASALIAEAEANGARYGVRVVRDGAGAQRLLIGDTPPLRPFFSELCDLGLRVPWLAEQGIDRQILSTWTDLAGDELPAAEAARWARLQNETLADAAQSMPERFTAMGTLPMAHPRLALAELDHIVNRLGIRSVEIGTNIDGRELDDPELRPLWKRLAELNVFVLLHPPRRPVGVERAGDYFLNNLICYPTDTTLAAARLLFSGILRDYPDLSVCLAHGGGFLPYQVGRFDRGFAAHPACRVAIEQDPSDFLGRFYYDTLTHHTAALGYLTGLVGHERMLFGSDYPFEMLDEAGPARIRALESLDPGAASAILAGNAQRLL